MDDPLDFIDFVDVIRHGDPGKWTYQGHRPPSPCPATSPDAPPGTLKVYESYVNEHGEVIEVHYFRYPDGAVGNVKVK